MLLQPSAELVSVHPERPCRAPHVAPVVGERLRDLLIAPSSGRFRGRRARPPRSRCLGVTHWRRRGPTRCEGRAGFGGQVFRLRYGDAIVERAMTSTPYLAQKLAYVTGPGAERARFDQTHRRSEPPVDRGELTRHEPRN